MKTWFRWSACVPKPNSEARVLMLVLEKGVVGIRVNWPRMNDFLNLLNNLRWNRF